MKTEEVIILVLALIAAAMLLKGKGGSIFPAFSLAGPVLPSGTYEIPNGALLGQPGYNWHYYSDGTAIAPDGTYYKNGAVVWTPGA